MKLEDVDDDEAALHDTIASDPGLSGSGVHPRGSKDTLPEGTILADRYLVEGCLGAGAMGEVYRVTDTHLGEPVALKRLTGASAKAVERFLREVRLSRKVTHRNVARTYDLGVHDGVHFLTMEIIEGRSLEDVLEEQGRFCADEVRRVAVDVCRGLSAAHEVGVVHRDLKPGNVMVANDGRVLLTDFGIARAAQEPGLTRAEQLVGTPLYMAPEQVLGRPVDARTDLYALGVMLFEMLTGTWPFLGETAVAVALARVNAEPRDPRSVLPVPDELADLILHLLARQPDDRPASAEAVAAVLTGHSRVERAAPTDVQAESSIAVLPFQYRGAADADYLGDALAEELTDVLGQIRGLRVVAYSSSRTHGHDADPRVAARQLGVRHVVLGGVQRRGAQVRITARLVQEDGSQLWSERFNGEVEDVFELQERLAKRIAEALRLELSVSQTHRAPREAVELYLRARRNLLAAGYSTVRASLEDLDGAIHLAPQFAPAYALHACASARSWFIGAFDEPGEDRRARAQESVARALEYAPELAESQLAAGVLALQSHEFAPAASYFVKALHITPTLALAHSYLAMVQADAGPMDDAERRFRLASELDPTHLPTASMGLARIAFFRGREDEFRAHADNSASVGEGRPRELIYMRAGLWSRDPHWFEGRDVDSHQGGTPVEQMVRAVFEYAKGALPVDAAVNVFEPVVAGIDNIRFRSLMRQVLVEAHCFRGEIDQAIRTLTALDQDRIVDVVWLDHCPSFEAIRQDPRFAALHRSIASRAAEVRSLDTRDTRTWS